MINCKKCGAPVPDGAPVCPNCRAQDYAPQPPKNNRKKLLIILFSLIGVLVALGIVIAVLLINKSKPEVNTFDFTCSQYTVEMNRILGENKLDENKWVVNEASAVYTGPGYQIDLKTDKDSEKVTEIGISPAGEEDAAKMAAASIMVAEPEIDQKTALSELAELSEKKQDEIISVETVVKIDEEKESYVITPRPKDKPAKKSTPDEIATTTAPPTTIQPTTAPHEYTAEELLDKSLDEIIEIMGGDFECSRELITTSFGTGDFRVWIYNNDILPGIAIMPKVDQQLDLSETKTLIKSGGQDYYGIVCIESGKYNDSFSADMTYNDIASQFGYRDLQTVGAERSYHYGAEINGRQVSFCFISDDELESHSERGYLSSDVLKEYNPKIHDIAVRHEVQETTTEESETTSNVSLIDNSDNEIVSALTSNRWKLQKVYKDGELYKGNYYGSAISQFGAYMDFFSDGTFKCVLGFSGCKGSYSVNNGEVILNLVEKTEQTDDRPTATNETKTLQLDMNNRIILFDFSDVINEFHPLQE